MPTPTTWSPLLPAPLISNSLLLPLVWGQRWAGTVTYSFPGWESQWATGVSNGYGPATGNREPWSDGFTPLVTSDQQHFRQALAGWSSVANIRFTEVAETGSTVGDLRAAYSWTQAHANAAAWTYMPGPSPLAGDIWFNVMDDTIATEYWVPGSYGYLTAMHEIGHAIGMEHPFDTPGLLPTEYDTQVLTIMSYSAAPGDPDSWLSFMPTTPMLLDIAALQALYGANTSFHTGPNLYTYNDGQPYLETIWDAGGHDTLRYDGLLPVGIDLTPGNGSALGLPVTYTSHGVATEVNNVWIAWGTDIEDATGGPGADTLQGNALANTLTGRGGNDLLNGGAGTDTALYLNDIGQYRITRTATGYQVAHKGGTDGTDTLEGMERITFHNRTIDLSVTAAAAGVPQATLQSVVELYIAFFNRVPDASGMAYWLHAAAGGTSLDSIAASFYGAAVQYAALTGYSQGMSNADFVRVIYKNVLGRDTVDEGGLAYWTGALADGSQTRGTLVKSILESAHTFKGNATYGWVADLLDNKYVVGKLFAVDMGLGFLTPETSISGGMQIAQAVTSTSTTAAIALIGALPADVQLL